MEPSMNPWEKTNRREIRVERLMRIARAFCTIALAALALAYAAYCIDKTLAEVRYMDRVIAHE